MRLCSSWRACHQSAQHVHWVPFHGVLLSKACCLALHVPSHRQGIGIVPLASHPCSLHQGEMRQVFLPLHLAIFVTVRHEQDTDCHLATQLGLPGQRQGSARAAPGQTVSRQGDVASSGLLAVSGLPSNIHQEHKTQQHACLF